MSCSVMSHSLLTLLLKEPCQKETSLFQSTMHGPVLLISYQLPSVHCPVEVYNVSDLNFMLVRVGGFKLCHIHFVYIYIFG
jgi:hypothetical protein